MIQVEPLARLMIPPKPGGKPREVLADVALCDEIIKAAIAAKSAMIAATASIEAHAAYDAMPDPREAVPAEAWCQCGMDLPRHRAAEHDETAAALAAELAADADGDPEPDLAAAYFLPVRVAQLLATPPGTIGGKRGDVVSRAEILYRNGSVLAAPAESWEVQNSVSRDLARLVRTWDIDWTGDQPRAVNEVQFAADPVAVPLPDAAAVLDESIATGRPVIIADDEPDEAAALAAGELAAAEVDAARSRERRSDSAVTGRDDEDLADASYDEVKDLEAALAEGAASAAALSCGCQLPGAGIAPAGTPVICADHGTAIVTGTPARPFPAVPFPPQEPLLAATEAVAPDGALEPGPFGRLAGFAVMPGAKSLAEAAAPMTRPVRIGAAS